MSAKSLSSLALVVLTSIGLLAVAGDAQEQQKPVVKIPEAGVPEIMTLEGKFVRAAYNNEGYAILGYQLANRSIGEPWMLIEFGATLRDGVPNYTLTREHLSLDIPDGQKIPLASIEEHRKANLAALEAREKVQRDSINYFPPSASQACRIGFFSELSSPVRPWNEVELSYTRGCVGRLFFQVPGGIKYGQYWLNVRFQKSLVRVPFRILTEEEERLLSRNYKDIRRQVQDAFKKKK
jgi:hypothetical protein